MDMNIVKLRRLIREEVERQLDGEDTSVAEKATFESFREWLGDKLAEARAPQELTETVLNTGRVDNLFVESLFHTWSDLRLEGEEPSNASVFASFVQNYPDVCRTVGLFSKTIDKLFVNEDATILRPNFPNNFQKAAKVNKTQYTPEEFAEEFPHEFKKWQSPDASRRDRFVVGDDGSKLVRQAKYDNTPWVWNPDMNAWELEGAV